jgi:hypothetical protein
MIHASEVMWDLVRFSLRRFIGYGGTGSALSTSLALQVKDKKEW